MIQTDEKTRSSMWNILIYMSKSLLYKVAINNLQESIASEVYIMEEKQGVGEHGKKKSAGRKRKINDCGLGRKNGNLLNI